MAIQKRALLHFVNFFASKPDVSGQRSLLPLNSSPWQKLIDPLPFQTSFCLTLTFVSEVVIHNFQNCLCSHTWLSTFLLFRDYYWTLRKTARLFKLSPWIDYREKIDDFVCLSSKELKLKHNVTGSKLNSQLFLKISLINCSETLWRALIHEDIWHVLPVSSVDFEILLLYKCQQHVTNLTMYGVAALTKDVYIFCGSLWTHKAVFPDDNRPISSCINLT